MLTEQSREGQREREREREREGGRERETEREGGREREAESTTSVAATLTNSAVREQGERAGTNRGNGNHCTTMSDHIQLSRH